MWQHQVHRFAGNDCCVSLHLVHIGNAHHAHGARAEGDPRRKRRQPSEGDADRVERYCNGE